ncbi:MAG TPA: DUF819 family protein [Bacteroidales bacterium]|nr:DUF819 family protein [Bacteroidales bacterium]
MIRIVILVLFYLFFPIVIIWLCKKWSLLSKIGTIGVAYLIGLFIGSIGIFPEGSPQYELALAGRTSLPSNEITTLIDNGTIVSDDEYVNLIATVQDIIPSIAVIIAFPLLLFSLNLRNWLKFASKGFLSIVLGLIAGLVMVTIGFFIWKDAFPESWKLAGMFEGMYTGGTPNFVAIQVALKVDPNLFVIATTYDIVVGAVLVLFFITVAPKLFRLILPVSKYDEQVPAIDSKETLSASNPDDFSGMLEKKKIIPLVRAFGIAIAIVAISGGLGLVSRMIFPQINFNAVVILSTTVLGIIASQVKWINSIDKSFQLGMYLILVFALTVSSMADLEKILRIELKSLVMFITWCYFGSLVLHLILAKIFRIDSDNFIITSTALIFSPPFVPLVAKSLKNKDVIVTGITGGIIGLMLGNLIGIPLAFFLQGF